MTPTRQSFALVSMALLPALGRVRMLYRALGDNNSLCESHHYQNLGYWDDGADSLDAAAEGLAVRVAATAGIGGRDSVLDVGCGFAEHDMLWAKHFAPQRIVAVNVCTEQLVTAARMFPDLNEKNVHLVTADAVRLPFDNSRFDAVLGVESAFHFLPRTDFFSEAFRVLRPGGRLVLADLCGVTRPLALKDRLAELVGRAFWQIPKENLVPRTTYVRQLTAAGFEQVAVDSIWHCVYPRFAEYARARLQEPDVVARLSPVFRRMLAASLGARRRLDPEAMDYVLASARKPVSG